jgi:hypothetical protein
VTAAPESPGPAEDQAAEDAAWADGVLSGQVMSAAEYIAGHLAAGQLKSAATPHALVKDVWPDLDPAVVQEIFNRGCATGWMGSQMYARPALHGEELASLQGQLEGAAFHAMGGMVAGSRRLIDGRRLVHPADGEIGRAH